MDTNIVTPYGPIRCTRAVQDPWPTDEPGDVAVFVPADQCGGLGTPFSRLCNEHPEVSLADEPDAARRRLRRFVAEPGGGFTVWLRKPHAPAT